MNDKIKLYTFYNERFRTFKERFEATLCDDYEVVCTYFDQNENQSDGDHWRSASTVKVQHIIREIEENMGRLIIHSDIDIQFFRPTEAILRRSMENKDICFQHEGNVTPSKQFPANLNTGFVVIRCNENSLKFWQGVLRRNLQNPKHVDQVIVNRMLVRNVVPVRWGHLPREIWAWSHGGIPAIPKGIALHHANCILSPEKKLKQMARVRQAVKYYFAAVTVPNRLRAIRDKLRAGKTG